MVKSKIVFVFIVVSNLVFSQQKISGKIYGEKAVAKHIKITNTTQGFSVYSDENGDFTIRAIENDTISFESSFYKSQKLIVNKSHFSNVFVVQLKKQVNQLDEVFLDNEVKPKEFSTEEYNLNLNRQIQEDMKNNSYKYGGLNPEFDVIAVVGLILKLFNKKKKANAVETYITYKEFDELFKKSHFFNDTLLKNTLKIPSEYKYLFFDYCEGQNIKLGYLNKENEFLLLNVLMKKSSEFLSFLN